MWYTIVIDDESIRIRIPLETPPGFEIPGGNGDGDDDDDADEPTPRSFGHPPPPPRFYSQAN